jgi:methionyl-tRNA synthetase
MSLNSDNSDLPLYLTTTLPYVNSDPHLGHALEFVQADCIARLARILGREVFFNTGTDEHGQKVWQKATEAGEDTQKYVDKYAARFADLNDKLHLSEHAFTRTTNEEHILAAQEFWRRVDANGDIYKKTYQTKYCVGCELEKTDSELVDGCCPIHPNLTLEVREEENYFFRFSNYAEALLEIYRSTPDFVIPAERLHEITSFIEGGLHDFSISRLATKMPWGIPVPDDPDHVMYVWFDALVNYISALGWPDSDELFEKFWVNGETVQFAGKDNLRQQSAMWQAMLLSAGLPPSGQIVIHGFLTSDGQKMSKSIGNVVDPLALVAEYGTDALRYYLLRHVNPFEDSDFTAAKFKEAYNANLANGLGNLVSRIQTMRQSYGVEVALQEEVSVWADPEFSEYIEFLTNYEFHHAADYLWSGVGGLDSFIAEHEPYKLIKTDPDQAKELVAYTVLRLWDIAVLLEPLLPETSQKIRAALRENTKPAPLFERRD